MVNGDGFSKWWPRILTVGCAIGFAHELVVAEAERIYLLFLLAVGAQIIPLRVLEAYLLGRRGENH